MQCYYIEFLRRTEDGETKHGFYVYALSEAEAKQRFLITTGYSKTCIVSVSVLK